MPHRKMEWDQAQTGKRRVGLQNTELLKGPSQSLAEGGSQAVLAALPSMAGLESESFQELADTEKGLPWRRGSPGLSLTFCLLPVFPILPMAHQLCPHSLAGKPRPSQRELLSWPSTHDLYNPGKNDQTALLSQGLGWQLSSPTAARSAGQLPARVQLRRRGDCHSWELGDRGQTS